ncbi:MAG: TlpA disulfide reductase family protein [Thiohalomonadales bacterium]|nr:TlpA disulfide reductase family protein [Thiohalomonadales bacterium]
MKKTPALIIVIAMLGLAGGFFLNQWLSRPQTLPATAIKADPDHRPGFTLLDLKEQPRSINDWDGQVILVNFWATWCPPCVREIPAFNQLYQTYKDKGFTIIGIALDNKQDVIDFISPMGVEFPILLGDQQGILLTQEYGNDLGVLPYTVAIDRQGRIIERHRSEMSYEEAERLIKPLL